MFEKIKNAGIAGAAILGGGVLASSSGCSPFREDTYGCTEGSRFEIYSGCRADVLAEKLADPKTKDTPEVAKLKSQVVGTLAEYVAHEIRAYQKGNKRGGDFSADVQSYLARCERSGLSAEFPESLKRNVEILRKHFEQSGFGTDNKSLDGTRNR